MSRLAHTIKNGWVSLLFHVMYIGAQFVSRNIFLNYLGDDFVGTTGTIRSIIQFLNLAELGIGAAVGFTLYQPIYEQNKEKVNEIIGYLGFLYKRIALIMLGAGIVITFFIPISFENSSVPDLQIIYLFLALLVSTLMSYFFAYHSFLLEADQKTYVNSIINQSVFILRLILQCFVLIYLKSIYLWITLELLTPILYVFLLRKRIKKIYPWLNMNFNATKEIRKSNTLLLTKIKQLSIHKIGNFVSNGTDNIIIFALINPESVAFLGNYQLVMNNINTLLNKVFQGTNASVGNLVAENNVKKMLNVFWQMNSIRFFLAGCTSFALYMGLNEFIGIWLSTRYIMDFEILLALLIIFFILQIRQPVDCYIQAFGLYADTWAPLVQSTINLALSIVFVLKMGIFGVLVGTITSQILIVMIWRPIYLFSKGFSLNPIQYFLGLFYHLAIFSLVFGLFTFIGLHTLVKPSDKVLNTIFKIGLESLLFGMVYALGLFFLSKGFKGLVNRLYDFLKSKLKK